MSEPLEPVRPAMSPSRSHHHRSRRESRLDAAGERSVFIPILLLALSVVSGVGFQAVQIVLDYRQLSVAQAALEPQYQAAVKMRAALDGLATATAKLADAGNANAHAIVEELRKHGVTIKPNQR